MDAIILAAGFATRLRPLSFVRPKVLVPICGRPLLDILLEQLAASGFSRVHINTHHLPEQVETFLQNQKYPLDTRIYHEEKILGTGGGIYRMASEVSEKKAPMLILNGDILAGLDLGFLLEHHLESGASVTMVMIDSPKFNNVMVDSDFSILAFGEKARRLVDGVPGSRLMAFTGIHVLNREIVLKYSPRSDFFSIIETYENAINAGEKVKALFLPNMAWQELGSVEGYWKVHRKLMKNPQEFYPWLVNSKLPYIDRTAKIDPTVILENIVCVGKNSTVKAHVHLRNVILWDNVEVKENVKLENIIVCDNCIVTEVAKNEIKLRSSRS